MFPISIVNQYGNYVAPALHIAKMTTSTRHKALLYANGELYTSGLGTSYQLGTGNNSTDYLNWNLVLTNVVDVYTTYTYTLARKGDNTWWHVGNKAGLYGVGGTNQTWTDCTSIFEVLVGTGNTLQRLECGTSGVLALMSNGDLYGTGAQGNGQLGLGSTDNYTSFILSNTGVQTVSLKTTYALIIKNNILYGAGANDQNQLGLSSTTNYTSWTAPSTAGFTGYTPVQVETSTSDSFLLCTNNSTGETRYLHAGYNNIGVSGGASGNHPTFTAMTDYDGLVSSVRNYGIGNNLFGMIFTDGVRSSGWNYQGATGQNNTAQQIRYFSPSVGLPGGAVQFLCTYNNSNTFVVINDNVYVAGSATYGSGNASNDYSFVKLNTTPY